MFLDAPAVYHQDFAGNCFENRQEDLCRSDGLGPNFDCSGFVIAAICKATGRAVADWHGPRHVRDFWQAAQDGEELALGRPVIGNALVTPRVYDIWGKKRVMPAHIGILTEVSEGKPLRWLHANPQTGRVEEAEVVSLGIPLGAISLGGVLAADFSPEHAPGLARVANNSF